MTDWLVADSLAPDTDGLLEPLYAHGALGELVLPHCGHCDQPLELDQLRCDGCGSTAVAWRTVEPIGIVHSVTTVHRRERGLILTPDPYHLVDVELASGHRLVVTTERPATVAPAIGDAVRLTFRSVAGVAIPALHHPEVVS